MIKTIIAAAAAVMISSPVLAADFTGPRIGGNVGYAIEADGVETLTYSGNIGYDTAIGNGFVAGVTAEIGDTEKTGRDLYAGARLGKVVGGNLFYGHAGYTNLSVSSVELDGYRVGVGVELPLTQVANGVVEYRHSNYEAGLTANQVVVGLSFRF